LRHGKDAGGEVGPVGVGNEDGRAGKEQEGPGRRGRVQWGKRRRWARRGEQATGRGERGAGRTEEGGIIRGKVLWNEVGRAQASEWYGEAGDGSHGGDYKDDLEEVHSGEGHSGQAVMDPG